MNKKVELDQARRGLWERIVGSETGGLDGALRPLLPSLAAAAVLLLGPAHALAQPMGSPATGASASTAQAAQPDLSGVWLGAFGRLAAIKNTSQDRDVVIGDWQDPLLQPWAAMLVKNAGALEAAGFAAPQPKQTCWPQSPPNINGTPTQIQVVQTPQIVALLYSTDHIVRLVYMNQPHSARVEPSWYGESVGHYEGNALVIDTIGITTKPMSFVDVYGTPHTDKLHVVERLELVEGGKAIKLDVHVEDPGAFTRPWDAGRLFRKEDRPLEEIVCAENIRTEDISPTAGEIPRGTYVSPF